MSSAILYAAIVAIWIGVLVPRWLRHENTSDGHLRLRRFSTRRATQANAGGASARGGFSQDGRPRYTSFGGPRAARGGPGGAQDARGAARAGKPGSDEEGADPIDYNSESWDDNGVYVSASVSGNTHDGEEGRPPSAERSGMADSERRARVVRGRRRMLWMLLVLAGFAVGLAYLGLAAWWIVVPPLVLLFGYLLLLREAAHADAEARERAAVLGRRAREADARRAREAEAERAADAQREQARRAAQAGTPPGGSAPVWAAHETLSHAEIIDISERVGDQLYDQYADAKLRAVGD